jgi:hypothetical protein
LNVRLIGVIPPAVTVKLAVPVQENAPSSDVAASRIM